MTKFVRQVFLKNEKGQRVRCRICRKPVLRGTRRKAIRNGHKTTLFVPISLQPVELSRNPGKPRRFVHAECHCISFGELRRGKEQGLTIGEMLGHIQTL